MRHGNGVKDNFNNGIYRTCEISYGREHGRRQRGPCPLWIFIHGTDI